VEIKNCTAIITGGASGLGEACVRMFVENGGNVGIFDLNEDAGNALAAELGDNAVFCKTNVADEKSVMAAIDTVSDKFGGIHFAVNCAGLGSPMKVLSKKGTMPIDFFNQVIQVNLIGTMNIIRLAAEKMVQNEPNADGEKGVVINTASVAAFEGQIGQAAYTASKAGVAGMTLPIAREFADYGIRVLTIAPGLFNTPMLAGLPEKAKESLIQQVPFPKRLGHPSEFASLAQHIVENPVLNGEVIRLDASIRMGIR